MDLSSTRNSDGDSEIVVTVGFRGSQLALGQDKLESRQGQNRRCNVNGRRSLPPEINCVEVVHRSRPKPDVIHWKAKVGE